MFKFLVSCLTLGLISKPRATKTNDTISYREELADPIFYLSPVDAFTHACAVIGCLILGGTGSGKSSGSGKTIRDAYLSCSWRNYYGYGFLVLTAKISEATAWIEAATKAGRENDLIVVNETNHWRCNLIAYLLEQGESIEQIVKRIIKAVNTSAGMNNQSSGGANDYFDKAFEQLLRNAITLIHLSGETITFENIYELVRNAPVTPEKIKFIKSFKSIQQFENTPREELRGATYFDACAVIARDKIINSDDDFSSYELEEALNYFFIDYAQMPTNQRQAVYGTFTANIEPLARGIYNKLFSSETNFTPSDSRAMGKIIVLDIPTNKYSEVGKFAQNFFADVWFSNLMNEAPTETTRICCFWCDEYQEFVSKDHMIVFSMCREYLIAAVVITQNLPALFAQCNDKQSLTKGISGNLINKFFHANNDVDSNLWAADLIGQEWRENISHSHNNSNKSDPIQELIFNNSESNTSCNVSTIRAYKVEPNTFNTLPTGGVKHELKVHAIITSNRLYEATNTDWMRVEFDQTH